MESRTFLSATDFTEAITASTFPSAVSDHATVKGKVTANITNSSQATQKAKYILNIVATTDSTLNLGSSTTHVIGSKKLPINLAAGASKPFTIPSTFKKGALADGNYTLYAVVTDSTLGSASNSPAGPTVTVNPPVVTLSETTSVTKLPATAVPGAALKGVVDKVSVSNTGTDTSTDPLTVALYASPDGTIANGTLINTVTKKVSIKPNGKPGVISVPLTTVPTVADGNYKIVAQVTQASGTITTSDPASAPTIAIAASNGGGGGGAAGYTDSILTAKPKYTYVQLQGYLQHITELDLSMEIDNTGAAVTGKHNLVLYASNSSTFDSSATQVGAISLPLDVAGTNGKRTFEADFGIVEDSSQEDGNHHDYYIFVQITDPNGVTTMASYPSKIEFYGPIIG